MFTDAVVMSDPGKIRFEAVALVTPKPEDLVVDIRYSGISTGTEKLFWTGRMPAFPGMGYPLVPGYESMGEVIEAPKGSGFRPGDTVFVPGADCYAEVRGLFGGAAARIVTAPERVIRVDGALGAEGALMALAATARHTMAGPNMDPPDLIVGHGVFGRLLARLTIAAGGPSPTVWEIDPARRSGASGYEVLDPASDECRNYRTIYDVSGQAALLPDLLGRIVKGGEIVLAGFYSDPISFAFPPAFLKEARIRVAAEWTRDDLRATRRLVESGALSLDRLITHRAPARDAQTAYGTAFDDPACLKMILDWSHQA